MKKFLVITTVLIMTLSFAACGENSNGNKDSSIGYGSNSENGSVDNNDSGMGSDIKSDINSGMSEIESFTESTIDGVTGNSSNNNSSDMNSGTNSNKSDSTANSSKTKTDEKNIKEKVLKHAGINQKDLKYFDIDTDYDDGRKIYDVDFVAGNMEYSYEIDATTGEILEHEKEIAD